jgi:hypothetical protein
MQEDHSSRLEWWEEAETTTGKEGDEMLEEKAALEEPFVTK